MIESAMLIAIRSPRWEGKETRLDGLCEGRTAEGGLTIEKTMTYKYGCGN